MKNKLFPIPVFAALLLALALGAFLPDALYLAIDKEYSRQEVFPDQTTAYEYIGTLENRVSAFQAYENLSPNVRLTEKTEAQAAPSLPAGLDRLFPDIGSGKTETSRFVLAPSGMNAHFAFDEYIFSASGGTVRAVIDSGTGKPVLAALTNAKEALMQWEKAEETQLEGFFSARFPDAYALAGEYARALGNWEISDLTGGASYGGSATAVQAGIRAQPFFVSIVYSAPAGVLTYRLSAADE